MDGEVCKFYAEVNRNLTSAAFSTAELHADKILRARFSRSLRTNAKLMGWLIEVYEAQELASERLGKINKIFVGSKAHVADTQEKLIVAEKRKKPKIQWKQFKIVVCTN